MAAALVAAVAAGACAGLAAGVVAALTTPRDADASAAPSPAAGAPTASRVSTLGSQSEPLTAFPSLQHGGEGGADARDRSARDRARFGAALALIGALAGALVAGLTLDLRAGVGAGVLVPALLGIVDLDRRRGLIADAHTLLVGLAGLLGAAALVPGLTFLDQAIGLALGLGLFAAVKFGARALRGVDGLGDGDVLLAGAGGLWTGWLWFGPWIGLAAGATLAYAGMTGRLAPGARIAFGPGLALSLPVVAGIAAMVA